MDTPNLYSALIFNPIEIEAAILPFELTPNFIVDRATTEEIEHIKNILPRVEARPQMAFVYFERECVGNEQFCTFEQQPSEEWKYYVVRSREESTESLTALDSLCNIARVQLDISSLMWTGHGTKVCRPEIILQTSIHTAPWQRRKISKENLTEIAELYTLHQNVAGPLGVRAISSSTSIHDIDGPFPEISRALLMLSNLDYLPNWSDLVVLGLFAIIEMLITHNPKLEDRGDSITHQLKGKIPLLERRFDRMLPYAEHFGSASSDKVWAALYSCRSAVAHGGKLDFYKNPLAILKSKDVVDKFLFEVVRSMLRHILREPNLYRDLRGC